MENQKLKEYFEFNEADLSANRNGRLSAKQLRKMKDQQIGGWKSSRWMGLIFLAVALVGVAAGVRAVTVAGMKMIERIVFGLALGLFWPSVWGSLGWKLINPAATTSPEDLVPVSVRGPVEIIEYETGGGGNYMLSIGGLEFDVYDNMSEILQNGDECAVYYLEELEQILSVEFISKSA